MNIIHFCTDEKFIDGAYYLFEKTFPSQNKIVLLKSRSGSTIQYIKEAPIHKEVIKNNEVVSKLITLAQDFDWVILHGMNTTWAYVVLNEKDTSKYMYMTWGAEIYNNYTLYNEHLLDSYGDVIRNKIDKKNGLNKLFNVLKRKIRNRKNLYKETPILRAKAFKKIRYVGVLYEEDFSLFQRIGVFSSRTKRISVTYYPLPYLIKGINLDIMPGVNVLVGNSASLSNNHGSIFHMLKELDLIDKRVIVPLSYGSKEVKFEISKLGMKVLPLNFDPLVNFMPLDEYTKLMQSCGVVIMNHYRQQAVGNVLAAVYLGAKVYLNSKSTLYHYLKRIGCLVYNVDEELYKTNSLDSLTREQIEHNRRILQENISEDVLVKKLKESLKK